MEVEFSLLQINEIADKIIALDLHKIVLFNGQMGAGKTTIIKQLCKNMGVIDVVSSPTFGLVNEYQTIDNQTIYHFDCYRIKSEIEALDMGIDEYLYSGNYCFIEWSEKIYNLIPEQHSIITIDEIDSQKRSLKIISNA